MANELDPEPSEAEWRFLAWLGDPDRDPSDYAMVDGQWFERERVAVDAPALTVEQVLAMVRAALATASKHSAKPEAAGPLLVSSGNCEVLTGLSWREVQALAKRLGVPVTASGSKRVIVAAELLAAFKTEPSTLPEPELDAEALVLARLGRSPHGT